MRYNNRVTRALSHAYCQWNGFAFEATTNSLRSMVRARLKAHQIVLEDQDILVTESGFVTMAIHIDRAVIINDVLVVPGADSEGLRGFLILRENSPPYHSLCKKPANAYHEFANAQLKANALLEEFGNKTKLRLEAQRAPWHQLITQQDLTRSGLCNWGSESFLRRLGLLPLAQRFGLPRVVLRLAGPYGDRVTAASILRTRVH